MIIQKCPKTIRIEEASPKVIKNVSNKKSLSISLSFKDEKSKSGLSDESYKYNSSSSKSSFSSSSNNSEILKYEEAKKHMQKLTRKLK